MADQLRMDAVVTDNATGPLRRIREELAAFRETDGMKSLKANMTTLREQTSEFGKAAAGASSVMGGIGVVGLGASLSIGKLVETFAQLAKRAGDLKSISQETGLSIDAINRFGHVASRFGLDPAEMDQALKTFGDKMIDFRRHTGEVFAELNTQRPELTKKLLGENPEQQIQEIFKFLDTLAPQMRSRYAQLFFGDGDISHLLRDGYGELSKVQEEVAQKVAKLTPEYQAQAKAFAASITAFNDSMDTLTTKVGPAVFGELKDAADHFTQAFASIKEVWEWVQKNKGLSTKDFVDQNGRAAGKAFDDALREKAEANAKAAKEGKGPLFDLPGLLNGGGDVPDASKRFQDDRRNLNPLFHKSSFSSLDGDGGGRGPIGGGSGLQDVIQRGTRLGIVQGLQDYADIKTAQASGGFGGGGGLQNAAYTTFGSGGRAGGSDGSFGGRHRSNGPIRPGSLIDGPVGKFGGNKTFDTKAPEVMRRLMKDLDLDKIAASKILGNLGHESAGFTAFHEGGKTSGTGGIGWAQWTGPRRREFEAWSKANHLDPRSDEASYGMLLHDLKGRYKSAVDHLRKGGSLEDFERAFEGAGIKAYGSRYAYARRALHALDADESGVAKDVPRKRPNLVDATKGASAGGGEHTFKHTGGAEITIKGLPPGTSTRTRTEGLIDSVKLDRASTMPRLEWGV